GVRHGLDRVLQIKVAREVLAPHSESVLVDHLPRLLGVLAGLLEPDLYSAVGSADEPFHSRSVSSSSCAIAFCTSSASTCSYFSMARCARLETKALILAALWIARSRVSKPSM